MPIDQQRIRTILNAEHSFYGSGNLTIRKDYRWYPGVSDLITKQLSPAMRVLDIGCGNGDMLLELSGSFATGVGIDHDPAHIQLAEAAKRERGNPNVEFLLLDFPDQSGQLPPESFDLIFSLRGPVCNTPISIQTALRLLRTDGLLFCEEIGERHQHEVAQIFADHQHSQQLIPRAEQLRGELERHGVNIRLAADLFSKWIYPDVYAWFQYQCNIWTWLGLPLPAPDDPRIERFAEQYTTANGEIETTHHVVWVAGIKP